MSDDLEHYMEACSRLTRELAAMTERAEKADALRQAHWDGRAIGGFDNDGNPTPVAVSSDFCDLIRSDWEEMRADLDEARKEIDALTRKLAQEEKDTVAWYQEAMGNAAERDKALAELAAEKERSAKLAEQRDAGWIHPEEVKSEIQALRHENDKLRAEFAVKTKRLGKAEAELSDSSDAPVRAVDGQTFYEDK